MKLYEKRAARFIIGTTQAGWEAKDVDYLCTGTDDQVQINNALNALPEDGGEVVILDGIYNIGGAIHVAKDNTTLRGSGNATVLKRMYNSDATYTSSTSRGLITLDKKKGCKIKNLHIDGNRYNYNSIYNNGILMVSSDDNAISNNTCGNGNYGIYLFFSSSNTITGNTCNNNYDDGIYLSAYSDNNTITGNTCNNNYCGIYSDSCNNNTMTENTFNNNSSYGIRLSSSCSNNCIVENVLVGNGTAYSGRGIGNIAANNVKK